MTARAVLVLVVCTGCAEDPSVSVRFEVPAGYQELVDTVALEVLAPPSDELDCDRIALGNATEQEQTAARVAEALVREAGDRAPLSDIPRTGRKLFVGRALGTSGQLVAGGCAEAATIDGDLEVVIEGEPALTVGARDAPSSGPLPGVVTLLLSDARGQPVSGARVEQTVYGAGNTAEVGGAEDSDEAGVVALTVPKTDWHGPQVLDVDVRWQANGRDLFSGFEPLVDRGGADVTDGDPADTASTRALYQVGRVGPSGEMGVAVLGGEISGNRRVHIYIYDPAGRFTQTGVSDPIPVQALGLIEDTERDEVVAMTATTWYRIAPDGQLATDHPPKLMNAVSLEPMGPCAADALHRSLLALSDTGQVALYDSTGARIADWQGSRPDSVRSVLAAGCVRGLDAAYPAAVYELALDISPRPVLVVDAPDAEPAPINSQVFRGVTFTPVLEDGEGPYLLANRFENDGNSIARYSAVPVEGAPTFLDEVTEDEIAGIADTTAAGDLDRDGRLDVAALVAIPDFMGGAELRFYVALGTEVEGQRLSGLADAGRTRTEVVPLLLVKDFDGDGIDDLLRANPDRFDLYQLEPD